MLDLRSSSISRTLANKLLHAFSFRLNSFILFVMLIVFLIWIIIPRWSQLISHIWKNWQWNFSPMERKLSHFYLHKTTNNDIDFNTFLVIFFPGLLILSIHGIHCRNTDFTWKSSPWWRWWLRLRMINKCLVQNLILFVADISFI